MSKCQFCRAYKCKKIDSCVDFLHVMTGLPNVIETVWVRGRSGMYHYVRGKTDANGVLVIAVRVVLQEGFFADRNVKYEVGIQSNSANLPGKIQYEGLYYDWLEFEVKRCKKSLGSSLPVVEFLNF